MKLHCKGSTSLSDGGASFKLESEGRCKQGTSHGFTGDEWDR